MRKKIFLSFKVALFVGFLFAGNLSSAKIHIEPYVGYSATFLSPEPIKETKTVELIKTAREGEYFGGVSPGMRLGYSSLGLAVGVDASIGYWKSLPPVSDKKTMIPILPGIFASYQLPLLFRAYGVLIPYSSVQIKSTENGNQECIGTRGFKMGVSYLSFPFLSVNFEYLPLYIRGGQGCRESWSHTASAYVNFTF